MAIKRSEQIDPENAGYYHLISRSVPKTFSLGDLLLARGKLFDEHFFVARITIAVRIMITAANGSKIGS